jgi:hypothetical protein
VGDPSDEVLQAPAGSTDGPTTIYEQGPDPDAKVNVRRLPRLIVQGFRIIMAAGRRDLIVSITLQTFAGFGLAVQLVLGQQALEALFAAVRGNGSLSSVAPWALAVAVVAFILFFANAVQRERQQILGELVNRHVEAKVLDVVTEVDLEAFETPGFFNRLERIRQRADQPLNLVWGVSGLAGAAGHDRCGDRPDRDRAAAHPDDRARLPAGPARRLPPQRVVLEVLLADDPSRPGAALPR